MSMAIAHEWISARAGSEKVFEELAGIYPDSDLYALTQTPGVTIDTGGRAVQKTWLNRLGPLRERRGLLLPAMPLAWRMTGRRLEYDVVITSSHACVKGFRPARRAQHFCYVHAPMRYVWNPEIDGRGAARLAAPARNLLGRWDRRSADWVDSFAANSSAVATRIQHVYGREARVISPPVDTEFFSAAPERPRRGLVSLGRLIPYKGHDISLEVAARLGLPITIVGRGPEEASLRQLAVDLGADATFLVGASDLEVRDTVAAASLLLFPANEDFGIVPVEAQAAGTPVVGPRVGGLLDTVEPGTTGELADELTVESMTSAAEAALRAGFRAEDCRLNAERFSAERFRREIQEWVSGSR